jgi:diacylglycerol O-acyltransferase
MATDNEKLSFQDAAFLRMESPLHPFHVAGLMILREPEDMPRGYYRKLVRHCGRLNELWPMFDKQLKEPENLRNPSWIKARDYDPAYHVAHYALPQPGRMDELLTLVSRVHERMLDRHRPLWEIHLIEGLPGGRFAMYCKVHHALVDGVGALHMIDTLFSTSADAKIDFRRAGPLAAAHHERIGLARQVSNLGGELRKHYDALPEMSGLLATMGLDKLLGTRDAPPLPYTAPRSLFDKTVDSRREIIISELSLRALRKLAHQCDATLNDVLLAICGGAIRTYLKSQDALPAESLEAGVPVSIKRSGQEEGNQVGFIICPLHTEESRPLTRLKRIKRVMNTAKDKLRNMSRTAAQDFTNLLMMPTILLTLAGRASQVRPALNVIVSNVPGSREQLFLEGAALEALYPLSVVNDGMGINITVVSYRQKLCIAVTTCPTAQPGIDRLGRLLKESFLELQQAAMS